MSTAFFTAQYAALGVVGSIFLAMLASYVALDLAQRVRNADAAVARAWWLSGSAVLGSGIWSMHFVGMLSFSLPIALGYTYLMTAVSWAAAVGVSAIALHIASTGTLTARRLIAGALTMGAGISAMHYLGMAALAMTPAIVWDKALVAASTVIAIAASAAALLIFAWLQGATQRRWAWQLAAAVTMGLAIAGMHYTGMAAASFPLDAICRSTGGLSGDSLGKLIGVSSVALLMMTLFTSALDRKLRGKAVHLTHSLAEANTQLQSANRELQRRAFLDPLTGLPNRLLLEDRLLHAVHRCTRDEGRISEGRQQRLALLFIDLDGFKPVNDSFGHSSGDAVLTAAAQRLSTLARDSDTVARIGGDEFVLLMESMSTPADCLTLAQRVVGALSEPYDLGGRTVQIACSVGIALYPDHGHHDKLIANADAAMYEAKRLGGNRYELFEPRMDAGARETLKLQTDLRHAAERGELELLYQPKVDSTHGKIRGVEALLRWNHPERGTIGPAVFIPIAERFGIIMSLGNWVIEEACRQMAAWADEGSRIRVAINLSVHQLRDEGLVRRIGSALERHAIDPAHLLCEITESVAMEDLKATQRVFEGLAALGVFLSIDDFGTGYSSLSYLRQLPAKQLKIDRAFVSDLETSNDARSIVDAVIRLAHALGLRVVAEGVETTGQRDILLELGCDELQGYLFARPMASSVLLDWAQGVKPANSVDFAPSTVMNLR